MTLAELHIGQDALIQTVGGEGALRQHLLDMGLTPGTEVTLRKVAPMGDPIELELRGYELTLRLDDAHKIEITDVHTSNRAAREESRHRVVPHPGVGELRKAPSYHERKAGAAIAKGQPLHFALAGNQNCGKTGKIFRNGRVWAMLDTLLTCDTISEARDRKQKQNKR